MTIHVDVLRLRDDARVPSYATSGAAGLDLAACIDTPIAIPPGQMRAIGTGLAIALPAGHEAQVRPRSGLAAKHNLTVLNTPGTIDEDYRGELRVLLINLGVEPFVVSHGDRIAQLVVMPVPRVEMHLVERLPPSDRGAGGFGSTGR